MNETLIADEITLINYGENLAKTCRGDEIIFLQGQLGAGKTTLVRGFLRGLGYQGTVKSPTYTLVESYEINHQQVFHFDLYRLHDSQELIDIGLEDYLDHSGIVLIEWPEKAIDILPKPTISCKIEIPANGAGRVVKVSNSR